MEKNIISVGLLLLLMVFPAKAVNKTFPVSVEIVKNVNGSQLSIETDRLVYTTAYRTIEETFDDVVMPFRVLTEQNNSFLYSVSLIQEQHECNTDPITVNIELDGNTFLLTETVTDQAFVSFDGTDRFSDHRLTLSYPVVSQTSVEQRCTGSIAFLVESQL